jgi:hypothetical protein
MCAAHQTQIERLAHRLEIAATFPVFISNLVKKSWLDYWLSN